MREILSAKMRERAKLEAACYLETFCGMKVSGFDGYSCPDGSVELTARQGDLPVLVRVRACEYTDCEGEAPECKNPSWRELAAVRRIMGCYLMDNYPCSAVRYDVMNVICSEGNSTVFHLVGMREWSAKETKDKGASAIGKAIGGVADSIMAGLASGAKIDERDAIESLCLALGVEPDGRDDWVADFARCLKAIERGTEA